MSPEFLAGALVLLCAFLIGVAVGVFLPPMPIGRRAKHRKSRRSSPQPYGHILLDSPAPPLTEEDLTRFKEGLEKARNEPMRLRERPPLPEPTDNSPWGEAVRSWRETAKPIDWGLTEEEKQRPVDPALYEAMHDPLLQQKLKENPDYLRNLRTLRDHYDANSTVEEMENGHWEGMSGSLGYSEPRAATLPQSTLPLPSRSAEGSENHKPATASIKPLFGATERLIYDPDDYEGPLSCNSCRDPLIVGQPFWAISLPEEGDGVFIPICKSCEAKSHA